MGRYKTKSEKGFVQRPPAQREATPAATGQQEQQQSEATGRDSHPTLVLNTAPNSEEQHGAREPQRTKGRLRSNRRELESWGTWVKCWGPYLRAMRQALQVRREVGGGVGRRG